VKDKKSKDVLLGSGWLGVRSVNKRDVSSDVNGTGVLSAVSRKGARWL